MRAVQDAGLRSTLKVTPSGKRWGGKPISSGHVYAMLQHPIYVGEIKNRDKTYPGLHEPIVSRETWDAVCALRQKRTKPVPHSKRTDHFLPGLLWDSLGRQMHLSIERDRGKDYHYYTSSNANWSQRQFRKQFRSHASQLDQLVRAAVSNFLLDREKLRCALKSQGLIGQDLEKLAERGVTAAKVLDETPAADFPELFRSLVEYVELGREPGCWASQS